MKRTDASTFMKTNMESKAFRIANSWHSVLYREKSFGEAWEGSDDNLQKPSAQWKRVPRCPGCFEFNKNDNEW